MTTTQTRIPLDTPIKRGETEITELMLRKPASGELRGLSLHELMNIKADEVITLLPRITTPAITDAEARRLDPADLWACGVRIVHFLAPKSLQQEPDGPAEASGTPAG